MIWVNKKLSKEERCWIAQNGATRRTLIIVNKLGVEIPANKPIKARVGVLDKGNHSFIFINPTDKTSKERVIFLNNEYGYTILNEEGKRISPLYESSSIGGYGNSESKFSVMDGEMMHFYRINTYKNRRTPTYIKFTPGVGFEKINPEDLPWNKIEEV